MPKNMNGLHACQCCNPPKTYINKQHLWRHHKATRDKGIEVITKIGRPVKPRQKAVKSLYDRFPGLDPEVPFGKFEGLEWVQCKGRAYLPPPQMLRRA